MITRLLKLPQVAVHCVLLALAGLLALGTSVFFDFVNWDDPAYIQHNDLIKGWSLNSLKGIATEVVTRNYAPVTIFSFLIDHTFWGLNPAGYHATNIGLHLINTVLVCLLVRQLTGSSFVGLMTAALFAVHPVQIESVVWVSSRKGLICSLFMLGAMLIRMRPDPQLRDDGWYFGLLALALFSKAHAVVLPPIVMLYDILIRRQTLSQAMVRQFIPAFMSLILLMLTMGAQNTVLGGVRGHMSLSFAEIVAVDVTILWQYLGMLACPTGLCVMYDPPTAGIWKEVAIGSTAWAAVAFALWKVRKSQPLWILGSLSFLLLLFPMLNFFHITTLMNDRYLYLPCVIVFAMAAGAFETACRRIRKSVAVPDRLVSCISGSLAILAVGSCMLLTRQHLPVWKNSLSLWTHALSQYPDMPVLRIQMALTLHDLGAVEDAVEMLERTLVECQPDDLDRQRMQRLTSTWEQELTRRPSSGIRSRRQALLASEPTR